MGVIRTTTVLDSSGIPRKRSLTELVDMDEEDHDFDKYPEVVSKSELWDQIQKMGLKSKKKARPRPVYFDQTGIKPLSTSEMTVQMREDPSTSKLNDLIFADSSGNPHKLLKRPLSKVHAQSRGSKKPISNHLPTFTPITSSNTPSTTSTPTPNHTQSQISHGDPHSNQDQTPTSKFPAPAAASTDDNVAPPSTIVNPPEHPQPTNTESSRKIRRFNIVMPKSASSRPVIQRVETKKKPTSKPDIFGTTNPTKVKKEPSKALSKKASFFSFSDEDRLEESFDAIPESPIKVTKSSKHSTEEELELDDKDLGFKVNPSYNEESEAESSGFEDDDEEIEVDQDEEDESFDESDSDIGVKTTIKKRTKNRRQQYESESDDYEYYERDRVDDSNFVIDDDVIIYSSNDEFDDLLETLDENPTKPIRRVRRPRKERREEKSKRPRKRRRPIIEDDEDEDEEGDTYTATQRTLRRLEKKPGGPLPASSDESSDDGIEDDVRLKSNGIAVISSPNEPRDISPESAIFKNYTAEELGKIIQEELPKAGDVDAAAEETSAMLEPKSESSQPLSSDRKCDQTVPSNITNSSENTAISPGNSSINAQMNKIIKKRKKLPSVFIESTRRAHKHGPMSVKGKAKSSDELDYLFNDIEPETPRNQNLTDSIPTLQESGPVSAPVRSDETIYISTDATSGNKSSAPNSTPDCVFKPHEVLFTSASSPGELAPVPGTESEPRGRASNLSSTPAPNKDADPRFSNNIVPFSNSQVDASTIPRKSTSFGDYHKMSASVASDLEASPVENTTTMPKTFNGKDMLSSLSSAAIDPLHHTVAEESVPPPSLKPDFFGKSFLLNADPANNKTLLNAESANNKTLFVEDSDCEETTKIDEPGNPTGSPIAVPPVITSSGNYRITSSESSHSSHSSQYSERKVGLKSHQTPVVYYRDISSDSNDDSSDDDDDDDDIEVIPEDEYYRTVGISSRLQ